MRPEEPSQEPRPRRERNLALILGTGSRLLLLAGLLAGLPPKCRAAGLATRISGAFCCTSSVPVPALNFTNRFLAQLTTNSYFIQRFDEGNNLLSQAQFDGQTVSFWWRLQRDSSSTIVISSLSKGTAEDALIRYPEEMVFRPLLWAAPDLCPAMVTLYRRAKSDPDYISNCADNLARGWASLGERGRGVWTWTAGLPRLSA